MKRYRFLFGASVIWILGGQITSVDVKADQMDDLLRASSASIEALNAFVSESAKRIQENNRVARELSEQSKSIAAQSENLIGQLKDDIVDLNEKINAIEQQIRQLKQLGQKLETVQGKIATLLPKLQDALGQDESVDESRQVLAAISQDRTKAAKLIQAIEENKSAAVGNLLAQGGRGPEVEVREVKSAGGAMIVFRVGSLTHCLSTKAQCGGKSSSLTKAAGGGAPKAAEAIKPLKDSLAAVSKQATIRDKAIERFLSAVEPVDDLKDLSQDLAVELQRLATQVAEAQTASSQAHQAMAAALEAIIRKISG